LFEVLVIFRRVFGGKQRAFRVHSMTEAILAGASLASGGTRTRTVLRVLLIAFFDRL
jgi:hypothetical protein